MPVTPTGNEYQLRVITHNLAGWATHGGSPSAIDNVVDEIKSWTPTVDVVMLQEITDNQASLFQQEFPSWDVEFTPMYKAFSNPDIYAGQVLASRHGLNRLPDVDLGGDDGYLDFVLLSAEMWVPGVDDVIIAGCVHLRAHGQPEDYDAREIQTSALRSHFKPYIDSWTNVVLAGDFNCRINRDPIDNIYRLTKDHKFQGPGQFFECDQTHPGNNCGSPHGACRDGEGTVESGAPYGNRKFDYIFFSNSLTYGYPGWLSGGCIPSADSDHDILRGWAMMRGTDV